jgi:hypothetical protein
MDVDRALRCNHARLLAITKVQEGRLASHSEGCKVDRATAARLVEFFTFRGIEGQEIWAQPLIPVNSGSVAPAIAALSSPNLRRLVDVWLRQAGVDLSLRGPAFEAHIRSELRQAIATSRLLSRDAEVLQKEFIFRPPHQREEEVDVVFRIGNTVFFCELKCILDPSDAKGVAMHRKTVREAVKQVQRKVDAAKASPDALKAQLSALGFKLTGEVAVHPLVVLSSSMHAGTGVDGVAVADEKVLTRYFEGELIDLAMQAPGGELDVKQKSVFYVNPDEAETRAPGYFKNPPQMRAYKEGISTRLIPIYAVADGDWQASMMVFDCVPRAPEIAGDQAIANSDRTA